ncbi:hypothetical protein EVJ50_06035 [Synechococcus sp. RSCCF101]|uniref:hypothetical protein n=1 Tax=Synechococcus sp. RSCCF101 TaxID=2511069 RepID=UPI001245FE5C|nr:hypothetical protein [Synechococcus sp. RSCCF101]QEY31868.1 hypothetical protein EVJ50_06035 [Synechococcus sp. RSCCF101]
MLIPIPAAEMQRLIPAVASGPQFKVCSGNPRAVLQRLLIAAIGGVISLLISQSQLNSRWGPAWLIVGFVFLLYMLWGPILEGGQRNAQLRRYPQAALFEGRIADLHTRERVEGRQEKVDRRGSLELVENRRTWLCLDLEDEDGYLGQLRFPMEKKHQQLRPGMVVRALVLSEYKDFRRIGAISDAWLPQTRDWVGEYPYLIRPLFEELCERRLGRSRRRR